MKNAIKKVPIPLGGLVLAMASLGALLANWIPIMKPICGVLSLLALIMWVLKLVMFTDDFKQDAKTPMIAAVVPISFIGIIVLDTYIAEAFPMPAKIIWIAALAVIVAMMIWFSVKFIFNNFNIKGVFTSWYIPFVGLCVVAWTSPVFGMTEIGKWLFWAGFITNILISIPIFYRYINFDRPEAAQTMFAIFPAPFAATIAAYLAVNGGDTKLWLVMALLLISQILFIMVLTKMALFLKMKFYPSCVGMTFPFVITASMLRSSVLLFQANGYAVPGFFTAAYYFEIIFATVMVFYVYLRYIKFLFKKERVDECVLKEAE